MERSCPIPLRLTLAAAVLLTALPAESQEKAKPAPIQAQEVALTAVARHLTDQYALYLYESLTEQILTNEAILERPGARDALKVNDTLWAQEIISDSILVEGDEGLYVKVNEVPTFFEDIIHRYMNAAHYWPDREITKETRRQHLAAWYSLYLMLLVGNSTQEEITKRLRNGAFNLDPGMLKASGPSLVDRLKKEGALSSDAYALVQIKRKGQERQETLTFPPYMDRWKAKIESAYKVTPAP